MTLWTHQESKRLIALWQTMPVANIAKAIGRTPAGVRERARLLKLPKCKPGTAQKYFEPPKQKWVEVATEQAKAACVKPVDVLAGTRSRDICIVRWRAWKAILGSNDNYSIAGVARVSGFDHSSVLHGLKRLEAMRAV